MLKPQPAQGTPRCIPRSTGAAEDGTSLARAGVSSSSGASRSFPETRDSRWVRLGLWLSCRARAEAVRRRAASARSQARAQACSAALPVTPQTRAKAMTKSRRGLAFRVRTRQIVARGSRPWPLACCSRSR